VRHVEVLEIDQAAWSLLILGDLDPYPPLTAPSPSLPTGSAKSRIRGVETQAISGTFDRALREALPTEQRHDVRMIE